MPSLVEDGVNIEFQRGGPISTISSYIGVQEAAIRLLISIFACYPFAAAYRLVIEKWESKALQHIYCAVSGFLLCYFNFGAAVLHSLIAIGTTYLLLRFLCHRSRQLITINFTFHMLYLLLGYYFTASEEYDILWTMPHCVLVLRMIGLVFDVVDGQEQSREKLSKDQLESALSEMPTLLELAGFAYFPCAFLVGPQFPFRRYRRFIDGEFRPYVGAAEAGKRRMLIGLLYLAVRQVGCTIFPEEYYLSEDFESKTPFWRFVYFSFFGKLALYKYISIWLVTEGALMCIGISYAGKNEDGSADWSGCCNVRLLLLETGNTMGHYVQSFNVNTNQWLAKYVYKRLKFLKNRNISYAVALGFLALWHGFHSGYYMSFFIEFMIVSVERQIDSVYRKAIITKYGAALSASWIYRSVECVVLKLYNLILIGWCFIPFTFLSYPRWIRVQASLYYFGFVYVIVWIVAYQVYKIIAKPEKTSSGTAIADTTAAAPAAADKTKSD